MDLIYIGSRKRQDLLGKLGVWGLLGGQKGKWERKEGNREIYITQYKQFKKPVLNKEINE